MNAETALKKMTGYPFADGVVDLEKYRYWVNRNKPEEVCMYDSGTFEIVEVNNEGYITLHRNGCEDRKIFVMQEYIHAFKAGDSFKCKLKRKVYFKYWEVVEYKNYNAQ